MQLNVHWETLIQVTSLVYKEHSHNKNCITIFNFQLLFLWVPQILTIGCSKSCTWKLKFRMSYNNPIVMLWGTTSLSDVNIFRLHGIQKNCPHHHVGVVNNKNSYIDSFSSKHLKTNERISVNTLFNQDRDPCRGV